MSHLRRAESASSRLTSSRRCNPAPEILISFGMTKGKTESRKQILFRSFSQSIVNTLSRSLDLLVQMQKFLCTGCWRKTSLQSWDFIEDNTFALVFAYNVGDIFKCNFVWFPNIKRCLSRFGDIVNNKLFYKLWKVLFTICNYRKLHKNSHGYLFIRKVLW